TIHTDDKYRDQSCNVKLQGKRYQRPGAPEEELNGAKVFRTPPSKAEVPDIFQQNRPIAEIQTETLSGAHVFDVILGRQDGIHNLCEGFALHLRHRLGPALPEPRRL
ncbi:MAG: hypothetical protein M3436_17755, partial [Pseudomonadota bacterium]|nr:hypothetical protein [Pseudomonadota bacterium]